MTARTVSGSPARAIGTRAEVGVAGTKAWIVVGALWFALLVWCMGGWVLGPDFVPNTFGRDQAPENLVRFVRIAEVLMGLLTAWLLWHFVLRPVLFERRLGFDGMFFLACGTLVLQEPWLNWLRPQLLYNTVFVNYGSWMGYLPGIASPVAEKVPVSIYFAFLGYFWIVAGPAWCGSRFISWARTRDPSITPLKLVGLCLLGFVVFDLIIEIFILRTGMFIYPSTIPSLTLWAGETYQFPVYEIFSWAGTYTGLACIHFFRNDKGETWADRGMDRMQIPSKSKGFARWLALVGICQVWMLVIYNIPYMLWALHGGPFTVTEETHPWLTAGLCGTSTPYDCPGPGVPIARRDSPTNRLAPVAGVTKP